MKTKISETIKKFNMISPGDKVVVGLSGGADSMCLLYILNDLKDEFGCSVSAAHLNHCIRGSEAYRDEEFVKEYCRENKIELDVLRVDIPAVVNETGESIELCARNKRYEFFQSLDADKIATAHSGSDRIETFFMNLSRGAGLNGLCSIPPVRDNIIRPLIDVTRAEIEEFCKENSIPFINDSTNFTDEYTRNKYRLNVLPEMKNINPSFEINALRCIRSLNDENELIEAAAAKEMNDRLNSDGSLRLNEVQNLPSGLFQRMLIAYFNHNSYYDYELKHISFIEDNLCKSFVLTLPGNKKLSFDKTDLSFVKEAESLIGIKETEISLSACFSEKQYVDKLIIYAADVLPCDDSHYYAVDAGKICESFVVRSRQSGDYIHLGRRHCSKTLKKLFNELKIPKENRDRICVVADEKGVIYVDRVGTDSYRNISSETKQFLIIKTECGKNE